MSAHIDYAYLELSLGADNVSALGGTAVVNHVIAQASAMVDTALINAGYAVPDTAPDAIKLATLGAALPLLKGIRRGLKVDDQVERHVVNMWRAIATGDVQIPGLTPTARDGIGGVVFSDSSAGSGREPAFAGKLSKVF